MSQGRGFPINILIIDGDTQVLEENTRVVREAIPFSFPEESINIDTCSSSHEAVKLIAQKHYDFIFSAIMMPGINGIELCNLVEKLSPASNFCFVTSEENFSGEAWHTFACGYILKPLTAEKINNVCRRMRYPLRKPDNEKLEIRCFGPFEVRYRNEYVSFSRKKSLEMLAVLIDSLCCETSVERIRYCLWDESEDTDAKKSYVHQLARDIRNAFSRFGLHDVLINTTGGYRLNEDRIDCDYYRWIEKGNTGKPAVYMHQYSWARESDTEN